MNGSLWSEIYMNSRRLWRRRNNSRFTEIYPDNSSIKAIYLTIEQIDLIHLSKFLHPWISPTLQSSCFSTPWLWTTYCNVGMTQLLVGQTIKVCFVRGLFRLARSLSTLQSKRQTMWRMSRDISVLHLLFAASNQTDDAQEWEGT